MVNYVTNPFSSNSKDVDDELDRLSISSSSSSNDTSNSSDNSDITTLIDNPYKWSTNGSDYARQTLTSNGNVLPLEIPRDISISSNKKTNDNSTSNTLSVKNKVLLDGMQKVQEYVALPGNIVRVVLEFPVRGKDGSSLTFELDDVVSLSYSVYRAKPAVVLLGQSSVDGFALGVKTVAGSIVRSVFSHDKLTLLQSSMYTSAQKERAERVEGKNNKLPKGSPEKELLSYMKDDLTTFNIHCVAITESLNPSTGEPYMKTDSIIGCMIINNGQVFSIEDLITEGNFSYQAKNVRSTVGAPDFSEGFSTQPAFKSVSEIMGDY